MSNVRNEVLEGLKETCKQAEISAPDSMSQLEKRINIDKPQTITRTAIRKLVVEAHRFMAMHNDGSLTDEQLVDKISAIRTQIASITS